jgi:AcrR family transcriptional regulator
MTGSNYEVRMTRATIRDICGQWKTKERLMAVGETLLGQRGFEGVSLEEIANTAQQKNKYAVQYHFGDRIGLANAILHTRFLEIDRRRLQALAAGVEGNVHSLLKAYLVSIADQVDFDGRCSFALFLQQIAIKKGPRTGIPHPLALKADSGTLRLFGMICAAIPHVERDRVANRLTRLMHLPLQFFGEEDANNPIDRSTSFDEIVAMMAAALSV